MLFDAISGLCRFSIRRPRATLALVAAVTLVGAAGLPSLELRTDGQALVPRNDPAVRVDADIRDAFGWRDPVVVYIETRNPAPLGNVA